MKKFISILMVLSMIFAFASCTAEETSKKKGKEEKTTKKIEQTTKDNKEKVTFEFDEDGNLLTTRPEAEESTTDEPSGDETTTTNPSTPKPDAPSGGTTEKSIEEFVALINTETKKASAGNYKLTRDCFVLGADFGEGTSILNNIIYAVDKNATLDTVINGFFDAGTTTATVKNGSASVDSAYLLKAMSLKLSDIDTYSIDGSYAFIALKSCYNPQFDGSNGLHHITNDFYTQAQVKASIDSVVGSSAITVNDSTFDYNSIILEVWTSGSKITKVKIAYHLDITLNMKISSVGITGEISLELAESYTNITY